VKTFFTKRKEEKREREARFKLNRKTKRKEEKLGAAEIATLTDDENSEVEVDSDDEALCAVLDQQKERKVT
jgi:hypothetical protein